MFYFCWSLRLGSFSVIDILFSVDCGMFSIFSGHMWRRLWLPDVFVLCLIFSCFSPELCHLVLHILYHSVRHSARSTTVRLTVRSCCYFLTSTRCKFCFVAKASACSGHAAQWCVTSGNQWSLRACRECITLTVDVSCMTVSYTHLTLPTNREV